MQSQGGFGRKGVSDSDVATKRAAFVAAERQRPFGAPQAPVDGREALRAQTLRSVAQSNNLTQTGISPEQAREAMGIAPTPTSEKSLLLAYVLWFFACAVSAHRFYLGAYQSAIVQMGFYLGGLILIFSSFSTKEWGSIFWLGTFLVIIGSFWILLDAFFIPGIRNRMERLRRGQHIDRVFS